MWENASAFSHRHGTFHLPRALLICGTLPWGYGSGAALCSERVPFTTANADASGIRRIRQRKSVYGDKESCSSGQDVGSGERVRVLADEAGLGETRCPRRVQSGISRR